MTMLTVFADASFCHDTKVGGWGAWAKREGWKAGRLYSGKIKHAINASSCELRALANALFNIEAEGSLEGVRTVMLQSDNMWALQIICSLPCAEQSSLEMAFNEGHKVSLKDDDQPVLAFFVQLAARNRITYLLRHVKGHQGGHNGRSWVNETCDRLAYQHMTKQRDRRKHDAKRARKRARQEAEGHGTKANHSAPERRRERADD